MEMIVCCKGRKKGEGVVSDFGVVAELVLVVYNN
jgi:hypothetical protein